MNVGQQAAVASILIGIAVASFVWWITGTVGSVQYWLKHRAKAKPANEDASAEE